MAKRMHYGKGSLFQKSRKNRKTKKTEYYGNFFIKYAIDPGKYDLKNLNTSDRNTAEVLFAEWVAQRAHADDSISTTA